MNERAFQSTLRRAFWIPLGIAAVVCAALIFVVHVLTERAASVDHSDQVITIAQRIFRNRVDQESFLRGFILTGDRRILDDFYRHRQEAQELEPALRGLVKDNPEQTKRNEDSYLLFQAWSAWADDAIALQKAGKDAGDPEFQFRGTTLMDNYRHARTAFTDHERQLRDERVTKSVQILKLVNVSIIVSMVLGALGFATLGVLQLRSLSTSYQQAIERADRNAAEARFQRDAVRLSEARFRMALRGSPIAVWECDRDLRFTFVDNSQPPVTDSREILGKRDDEILPPEAVREILDLKLRILATGIGEHRQVAVPLPNRTHYFDLIAEPIRDASGEIVGLRGLSVDITNRRVAEEQVAESHRRLSGLIDSAMDAIIAVNADQRIELFNPAAERIFRCSASDALGSPLDRFIPARYRDAHRHHIENFAHTGITNRSMSRPGTLTGVRHNGEEFPIEATISQVQTGHQKLFTVILRDISERKAAEDKLAEQAGLLESAWDAILIRNERDEIEYWNRGAEELYGWTREEALGKISQEFLQTQLPEPLPAILKRLQRENHWQGELVHTAKNGQQVTVLSRWALLPDHAQTGSRRVMEINTDVTRRKQLEAALQANERLAVAGQLSASIAHEIHNPLDTVGNILYILRQGLAQGDAVDGLIVTALDEVQRVAEISRNMLSLHRESQAVTSVDLQNLLEGVIDLIQETIARRQRRITLESAFRGDLVAFPSQLRQVFTNVLKNAVEATGAGGEIRIHTENARQDDRDGVVIHVADNGTGVPEQVRSRLFNPFVSTKEESGTGLGLWVSRNIIEKHGGSIKVDSNTDAKNHGTTVSIFLPLRFGSHKSSLNSQGIPARHKEVAS